MIKVLLVTNDYLVKTSVKVAIRLDPGITLIINENDPITNVIQKNKPNIVLIDVNVSYCLEFVKEIMSQNPVPILLLLSQEHQGEERHVLNCLNSGALDIFRLLFSGDNFNEAELGKLTEEIRLISKINVFPKERRTNTFMVKNPNDDSEPDNIKIIGIGASTGGPKAIVEVLKPLPKSYPIPIIIVQHIVEKFLHGLTDWLSGETALKIKIGNEGEILEGGTVYFAPDGTHTIIEPDGQIAYNHNNRINGCKPSIDILMSSLADSFGKHALGIILTGMGKDGATGLTKIRQSGGQTIAQDEVSSTVFGMPRVAIESGAINTVLSPKDIGKFLVNIGQRV